MTVFAVAALWTGSNSGRAGVDPGYQSTTSDGFFELDSASGSTTLKIAAAPEPGSLALFGRGAVGLALGNSQRRSPKDARLIPRVGKQFSAAELA
ncbi:MAG TPA: PEP-CTERM sorting domain-containing protein [Pirellulales bacterium]|nr:PEP-CTERM sorting domain-containing protein [Pirellulales bacterium]